MKSVLEFEVQRKWQYAGETLTLHKTSEVLALLHEERNDSRDLRSRSGPVSEFFRKKKDPPDFPYYSHPIIATSSPLLGVSSMESQEPPPLPQQGTQLY